MDIRLTTALKDIANAGEAARLLLDRCGLDFCCEGDRSLGDACAHAGLRVAPLEAELRTLPSTAARDWAHEGISTLLDHVLGVCHPETSRRLAELEAAARAVRDERAPDFQAAVDQLVAHAREQMSEEEGHYFVRVRALADARKARGPFPPPPFRTIHEHERDLREGHAETHAELRRVQVLAAALEGPGAAEARGAVDAVGRALPEQMHLENNELLPRARDLEPNGRPAGAS